MNRDTQFEKKVLKPAIKEVRKYQKKHGTVPDKSIIRELKIQIINPFIRLLSSAFGLFLLFIGFFSILDQAFVLGSISTIVGFILLIFAFRGKKKKLEDVVEKSDTSSDIDLIIQAILFMDW